MHNYQRISYGTITELLHKFVKNAVKLFHAVVRPR